MDRAAHDAQRRARVSVFRKAVCSHKEVESRRGVVMEAIAGLDAQGKSRRLSSMSAGSIDSLGSRFLPFRIIHLEMVDLTGIEPVTS
jgi:hypothetical protein